MSKIYLAIPFSGMEDISFQCANEVASLLIAEGHTVFSPISHSHSIWKTEMVPHTHEVWMEQDRAFVEWADEIYVVHIKGYPDAVRNSKGVQIELGWASDQGKNITHLAYDTDTKKINYFAIYMDFSKS